MSVSFELHESRGKTHNSRRWVDLDAATVHVLAHWRDRLETELGRVVEDDYVFCTPTGAPTHPDRFTQIFNKLVPPPVCRGDCTTFGTRTRRCC